MAKRTTPKKTPFTRLLVANRGEIAIRVMETARRMGLFTIAVYSDADREALHVGEADRSERIGGAAPSESYLSIAAIIAAAKRSGAEAIHPGYGFLAENADFARACVEAGLIFVGPAPETIAAMGDKAAAKAFMAKAGVPVVPGYEGEDQDEKKLAKAAKKIGFPVMIKAIAGGGGRGMRLVEKAEDFAGLLATSKTEAKSAFGDDRVLIEKAILDPRHIEIQVFGDKHGNVVHLGERDCSVQRRHQKLIEEAPSPAVSAELREKMGSIAVNAAKALGYVGAGTLEFLLDRNGDFYFMEMNTRLQVEHRVTEAIFNCDLVKWQLRVAMGEALPRKQEELVADGHAIEVRLCAEDPVSDFMPQSGRLAAFAVDYNIHTRDVSVEVNSEVTPHYDSMIAKLVVQASTRDAARRQLIGALENSIILGLPTNLDFLHRAASHPVFVAGEATTGFVAANKEALTSPVADDPPDLVLAALALYRIAIQGVVSGRHLGPALPRPMVLGLRGERVAVSILRERDGAFVVTYGATAHRFERADLDRHWSGARIFSAESAGSTTHVAVAFADDAVFLQRGSRAVRVDDLTFAPPAAPKAGGDGVTRAAMNGRVVAVHVAPGAAVNTGDPLVTLEAMKMQHVHASAVDGLVQEVLANPGDQVATGRVLVRVEPAAAS